MTSMTHPTPLCPVGHLPHKGGDHKRYLRNAKGRVAFSGLRDEGKEQFPPLWGRCHAVTEGGKASTHPILSRTSTKEAAHAPRL